MATLATGRSGVALVLASWCWLAAAPARAQWVPNGVPLCTADGSQTTPFITPDGQGGAIVGWRDGRDLDTYLDIYAQRVTAKGMIAPGWPRDGVAVCADSAYQSLSGVASDGLGGAYFVWEDDRNYDANLTDVYLQRVSAEGAIVPGW